jgi:predicted aspartyl protease
MYLYQNIAKVLNGLRSTRSNPLILTVIIMLQLSSNASAQTSSLPQCNIFNRNSSNGCVSTVWIDIGWYWGERQKWDHVGWYSGELHNGKPEGNGTYSWGVDGGYYTGEFHDGRMDGKGTRVFADGTKVVGKFRDGMIIGVATEITPSGVKYTGEFRDNLKNGHGTLKLSNGKKLTGEFENNEYKSNQSASVIENETSASSDNNAVASRSITAAQDMSISGSSPMGAVGNQNSEHKEIVPITNERGVYLVPVNLNGILTLNAIVDSGASDVSIPADIVSTLIRTNTISDQDFIGVQTYILADGTKVPSAKFRIHQLKVGKTTLENVDASISSSKAEILLGQSFFKRFRSWSIDNDGGVIIFNK